MIDVEVWRLRQLRNTVLRARAIAKVLHHHGAPTDSMFSRSAMCCWSVARITTGRLRAHPYLRYQRDPSGLRGFYNRFTASLRGNVARLRGHSVPMFQAELQRVANQLDDARALTWSAELSDSLGRCQLQIRRLLKELDAASRMQNASNQETMQVVEACASVAQEQAPVPGNWPYLAL